LEWGEGGAVENEDSTWLTKQPSPGFFFLLIGIGNSMPCRRSGPIDSSLQCLQADGEREGVSERFLPSSISMALGLSPLSALRMETCLVTLRETVSDEEFVSFRLRRLSFISSGRVDQLARHQCDLTCSSLLVSFPKPQGLSVLRLEPHDLRSD
jgi:hypothetical protein